LWVKPSRLLSATYNLTGTEGDFVYSGYLDILDDTTGSTEFVRMYESSANAGEYWARHYDDPADPTLLGVIGTIDFGSSDTFVPENFLATLPA